MTEPLAPAAQRRTQTANTKKRDFLKAIEQGCSVKEALERVGRKEGTYEYWRKSDEDFKAQVDQIRSMHSRVGPADDVPDFATFRLKYLGSETFLHQLQWIDVLEGREPRGLHPSQTYEKGRSNRVLINTPPEHAKSTVITMDYATYRIIKDPNIRILIVSKSQTFAKKFLYGIKTRLSHPKYVDLIRDFGPMGGFRDTADIWSADMIYLGSESRDSGEKDPTVQALGIGGQIYGARADLIILDDCVVLSNAHEYDKQIDWITQEVSTRLGAKGSLLVVGTRVAANDLSSELRKADRYTNGVSPWTYLSQPAVLEIGDDPKKWVTMWPRTDRPCGCTDVCNEAEDADEDGFYRKWDGEHLNEIRNSMSALKWSLVYMQQQVSDDAIFADYAVKGALGARQVGPLVPGAPGHRRDGMEGLYVIAGLDPAMTRATAAVVMGVDRTTRMRYVLDVHNENAMTPAALRNLIKDWTIKYGVQEWRIEKNAFQLFLTQDEELNSFVRGVGSTIKEHYTGANKLDANFGVASVANLFGEYTRDEQLVWRCKVKPMIELPSPKIAERVKQMIEQLVSWGPDTKNPHDIVMALWFAEIRAREVCHSAMRTAYHAGNPNDPYLSKARKNNRVVVNLDDLVAAQRNQESERHLYVV